jgi:aminopeptidase N
MRKHVAELLGWYGTGIMNYSGIQPKDRLSYLFNYRHEIRKTGELQLHSRYLAGLWMHKLGWSLATAKGEWDASLKYMKRSRFEYLNPYGDFNMQATLNPEQGFWSEGSNFTANVGRKTNYRYFDGSGSIGLRIRTAMPWSDSRYGIISAEWLNKHNMGKLELKTRVFAAAGEGKSIPSESAIYAWGANPEELQDNKFTRALGAIPLSDMNTAASGLGNALGLGGGLNIRGMQGYMVPVQDGDTVLTFLRGSRGAAVNAELDFTRFFSFMPKLGMLSANIYLFGDAGIMGLNNFRGKMTYSGLLADAGLGMVLSIKNWNRLTPRKKPWLMAASPLNIRLDLPFFVNAVPEGDDNLKFRWVLGINRAF